MSFDDRPYKHLPPRPMLTIAGHPATRPRFLLIPQSIPSRVDGLFSTCTVTAGEDRIGIALRVVIELALMIDIIIVIIIPILILSLYL